MKKTTEIEEMLFESEMELMSTSINLEENLKLLDKKNYNFFHDENATYPQNELVKYINSAIRHARYTERVKTLKFILDKN